MAGFTTREYVDMHFVYGLCNGNALAAEREYRDPYPDRRCPKDKVFTRLHQRLLDTGSVVRSRRENSSAAVDVGIEDYIIDLVTTNPNVSSRDLASEIGVSHWYVLKLLNKNHFHPYHFTQVQALEENDFAPREEFCRWLLNSDIEQYHFFKRILWTDESLFTREGVFNTHNMHHWATENPHASRQSSFQRRFKVNVWAGIVGDQLIGPHFSSQFKWGELFTVSRTTFAYSPSESSSRR